MKAPGFANSFDKTQEPSMGGPGEDAAKALDGSFTPAIDVQIVSQNEEGGMRDTPQGKRIVWTINPQTTEAPNATLRFAR